MLDNYENKKPDSGHKPLISVIVPVYRVEKFLNRCIDSIVGQTYENLEIILIDDGSPDNCPAICDSRAERDQRIIVIHQENKGVSAARNVGLSRAQGEYIGFIDSDDFVLPTYFETLYELITANEADISMCKCMYVDEDGDAIARYLFISQAPSGIFTGRKLLDRTVIYNVWGLLFRAPICRSAQFSEKYIFGEDYYYMSRLLPRVDKIAISGKRLYRYTWRENSAMGQMRNKLNRKMMCNEIEIAIRLCHYFKVLRLKTPADNVLYYGYCSVFQKIEFGFYREEQDRRFINRCLGILVKNTFRLMKAAAFPFFVRTIIRYVDKIVLFKYKVRLIFLILKIRKRLTSGFRMEPRHGMPGGSS